MQNIKNEKECASNQIPHKIANVKNLIECDRFYDDDTSNDSYTSRSSEKRKLSPLSSDNEINDIIEDLMIESSIEKKSRRKRTKSNANLISNFNDMSKNSTSKASNQNKLIGYLVTLSPRVYNCKISRQQLFDELKNEFSLVIVSEEPNQPTKYRSDYQFKILIQIDENKSSLYVHSLFSDILRKLTGSSEQVLDYMDDDWRASKFKMDDEKPEINLKKLKALKKSILSVTEFDMTPCYQGIHPIVFHENWKNNEWAFKLYETLYFEMNKFDFKIDDYHNFETDTYVFASNKGVNYFRMLFDAFCRKRHIKHVLMPIKNDQYTMDSWMYKVIQWYNEKISNPSYVQSLYLYGENLVDMNIFINDTILKDVPSRALFNSKDHCVNEQISWQNIDSVYHTIGLCQHFEVDKQKIDHLEAALLGKSFEINYKKSLRSKLNTITFNCHKIPFIFIGKYPLHSFSDLPIDYEMFFLQLNTESVLAPSSSQTSSNDLKSVQDNQVINLDNPKIT